MATSKARYQISFSPETEQLLKQVCARRNLTKSQLIESLVRLVVDDHEVEERMKFWHDISRVNSMTPEEKSLLRHSLNIMHNATLSKMGLGEEYDS